MVHIKSDTYPMEKHNISNMKKSFLNNLWHPALLCGCCLLAACRADVDLNNIDTTAEIEMGVALPIGSMSASINDFMGGSIQNVYIDTVENYNVLTFRDTFRIEKKFHQVDLSQYLSRTSLTMNVYDKLEGLPFMADHKIMGNDAVEIALDFPMTLKLDGINKNEEHERLDSALIDNASFISMISAQGGLPLKWEWINSVSIELGDAFTREAGNIMEVYRKGDGYGYGQNISINVDKFSLNLMKNKNPQKWEDYHNNVIDSCNFIIHFKFTVPTSAGVIEVPESAAFSYDMGVQFIDYTAIWGMFKPSGDMSNEDRVSISESWDAWKTINSFSLPFYNPTVDMNVTTQIAGALMMQGDYLYVEDAAGNRVNATFDGSKTLYKTFSPEEYLPLSSQIGDSATMTIKFDKDPSRGHIDHLFAIHPEYIGYKFSIDFNRQNEPQIRITPNTGIRVDAVAKLPFMFNQGVELQYGDTVPDVNLSAYTLDSLLASTEIVDTLKSSNLKLFVKVKNAIPLRFKASMKCLDENQQVIMDPDDPTQPLRLTTSDTLKIAAALSAERPGETAEVIEINKKHFDAFASIKSIVYDLAVDDNSADIAFDREHFPISIKSTQKVELQLGITANIDAVINIDGIIKPDNNQ